MTKYHAERSFQNKKKEQHYDILYIVASIVIVLALISEFIK
jgi:hypothetical protein